MQSKSYPPTALQRKWHQAVRESGCPCTGRNDVQVHHLGGASMKINKVHVGQWLVMAIAWDMHDPNTNHPFHASKNKQAFHDEYGTYYDIMVKQRERVIESHPDADFIIPDEVMELAKQNYAVHENTASEWEKVL